MFWLLLLYGVVPLIVFAVVDSYSGARWAVVTAAGAAFADIFITRAATGEWDPGSGIAFVLVGVLGWLTIKLDSSLYFKMQPVLMSIFLAGLLAYYQFFAPVPLLARYLPVLREVAPASLSQMLNEPAFYNEMNETLTWMIGFFLAYALIMAIVAWRFSTMAWLLMRGIGFWGLLLASLMVRLAFSMAHA